MGLSKWHCADFPKLSIQILEPTYLAQKTLSRNSHERGKGLVKKTQKSVFLYLFTSGFFRTF